MGKLSFQFVVSCFLVSPTPTIYAALVDIMCTSLACEAGDQMPQVHYSYIHMICISGGWPAEKKETSTLGMYSLRILVYDAVDFITKV